MGLVTMSLGAFVMSQAGSNEMMNLGGKFSHLHRIRHSVFGYIYAEFAGWEYSSHGHSNPAEALPMLTLPVDLDHGLMGLILPFGIELAFPFHRVTLVEDHGNLEHLLF